jgi:ribosomal-protein-alanine N-acetyltransferase
MSYLVRPIKLEDIPQVTEIDREAFPTQWPPPSFKRELNNRLAHHLVAAEVAPEPSQQFYQTKIDNPSSAQLKPSKVNEKRGWQRLIPWLRPSPSKRPALQELSPAEQYLIGYASIWLMADEAHLTSIAVRATEQRKGLGELLLISVINLATELDAQVATLEVRVSNLPALALYRKYGFKDVGVRRGYYSDDNEDALIMTTDKLNSAGYQQLFQDLKRGYRQKWGEERRFLS